MGQKTNPNIFRLGINKEWNVKFSEITNEEHTLYNYQNIEIKNFIKKKFKDFGLNIHFIKLGYTQKYLYIFISYYFTDEYKNICKKKTKSKKIIDKHSIFKKLNTFSYKKYLLTNKISKLKKLKRFIKYVNNNCQNKNKFKNVIIKPINLKIRKLKFRIKKIILIKIKLFKKLFNKNKHSKANNKYWDKNKHPKTNNRYWNKNKYSKTNNRYWDKNKHPKTKFQKKNYFLDTIKWGKIRLTSFKNYNIDFKKQYLKFFKKKISNKEYFKTSNSRWLKRRLNDIYNRKYLKNLNNYNICFKKQNLNFKIKILKLKRKILKLKRKNFKPKLKQINFKLSKLYFIYRKFYFIFKKNQSLFLNFVEKFFITAIKFNKNEKIILGTKKELTFTIIKLIKHSLILTENNKNLVKNLIIFYIFKTKKLNEKYRKIYKPSLQTFWCPFFPSLPD